MPGAVGGDMGVGRDEAASDFSSAWKARGVEEVWEGRGGAGDRGGMFCASGADVCVLQHGD